MTKPDFTKEMIEITEACNFMLDVDGYGQNDFLGMINSCLTAAYERGWQEARALDVREEFLRRVHESEDRKMFEQLAKRSETT